MYLRFSEIPLPQRKHVRVMRTCNEASYLIWSLREGFPQEVTLRSMQGEEAGKGPLKFPRKEERKI